MKAIKDVAIVGLGAIGSVYAVKFHNFDHQCLRVIVTLQTGRLWQTVARQMEFGRNQDHNFGGSC